MKCWSRRLIAAAAVLVVLVPATDAAVSLLLRNRKVSAYLTGRLETAFGRPVQVGQYGFSLWEGPRIEADSVTVGEDPRFGNEYFLRAQSIAATLRWSSLLRGRIDFGSFSLSDPSLNVVDVGGRWNLEAWLSRVSRGAAGGVARAPRLYRIDVSGGRIDFKHGVDKLAFALVDVNGSVDEVSPNRWTLSLDAQPMRAAVNLQDAGTLHLSGAIGGASARLRPASLHLRWGGDASLSDILRLAFGTDYGVRGHWNLDLEARSNGSLWHFVVEARTRGMHRWDFVAASDNPLVNADLSGTWSPEEGRVVLASGRLSAPGSAVAVTGGMNWPIAGVPRAPGAPSGPQLSLRFTTSGIAAGDLLDWYRSFHSGISRHLRASGWLEGSAQVGGWPPRVSDAKLITRDFHVEGGGLSAPVVLSAAHFSLSKRSASLVISDLHVGPRAGRFRIVGVAKKSGAWRYNLNARGSTGDFATLATDAQILGARLGSYSKQITGSGTIDFQSAGAFSPFRETWRSSIELRNAVWREPSLPARVRLASARLRIASGRFRIDISRATALGADWRGWLRRDLAKGPWQFNLSANRLDLRALAARLAPRTRRPSLLERIFGFGHAEGSSPLWLASLDAAGELRTGEFSVAPFALQRVSGRLTIRHGRVEFSPARGRFYGGSVEGLLTFSARNREPVWRLKARLDGVNLAGVSRAIEGKTFQRFSGRVSGTIDSSARGATGRSLLESLDGQARITLTDARDRRIDWLATLGAGHAVPGASAFRDVSAQVRMASGTLTFDKLALSGAKENLTAVGTLDLAHGDRLEVEAHVLPISAGGGMGRRTGERTYRVIGSAASPRAIASADPVTPPAQRR